MVFYSDTEPVATDDEESVDNYGYNEGVAADEVDFGYDDVEVDDVRSSDSGSGELQRPKRRCSITKYSLEGGAATGLDAACVIRDFRNGRTALEDGKNATHVEGPEVETYCGEKQDLVRKVETSPEESDTDLMADSTSMSTNDVTLEIVKEVTGVPSCSLRDSTAATTKTPTSTGTGTRMKRNNILGRLFRRARQAHAA